MSIRLVILFLVLLPIGAPAELQVGVGKRVVTPDP